MAHYSLRPQGVAVVGAIALVALVLATGLPHPDSAVAAGVADTDVRLLTPEQALETDLQLTADANGWTVREARANYESARAVGRASTQVRDHFPEVWLGSELATMPEDPPTLYIKGKATEAIRQIVAAEDSRIIIRDDQPYSYDELIERRDRVHDALARAGYDEVATRVNIVGKGAIPAGVRVTAGLPSDTEGVLAFVPKNLRSSVVLTIHPESLFDEDHALGGMKMTYTGDNSFCTSGFTVYDEDGVYGVIGASHCIPKNRLSSSDHHMTLQGSRYGTNGDVAWWTTDTFEDAKFYADTDEIRLVGGSIDYASDVSLNETVCLFGRGQGGRDCSAKIDDKSISCGSLTNMVLMTKDVGEHGDSGGPWFYGGVAYGIHHGKCSTSHPQDVYTPTWNIDNVIGVYVVPFD